MAHSKALRIHLRIRDMRINLTHKSVNSILQWEIALFVIALLRGYYEVCIYVVKLSRNGRKMALMQSNFAKNISKDSTHIYVFWNTLHALHLRYAECELLNSF